MSGIRVAIAVAEEALDRVQEVLASCRALGFRADSALTGVGIFTGWMEAQNVGALREVPGVVAVELERSIRIHTPRA
jgi:hypothetical protein